MELELAALINTTKQQQRDAHAPRLSPGMQELVKRQHLASLLHSADPMSRLEGGLAVNCRVDLDNKSIVEAASAATFFRGYESLLPGRALDKVGLVSATASGICGGVHATASALCLEMALGIKPPPFGIVLRNLLLSCQYLSDNCMHLFVLAGPDYSQAVIEKTNPDIWTRAQQSKSQFVHLHGFSRISDIMVELNKGTGSLYREALQMVSLARQAYVLLGGKYPHSESIIPGGVSITADAHKLAEFSKLLQPFMEYSQKAAAIWDDIFDFMLAANPRYEDLGRSDASLLDFGQWDHPDHYDGRYQTCDIWGQYRWSTPAAVINGKLACISLSQLNAGMEESLDYSFQTRTNIPAANLIKQDPLGNAISERHPWNKKIQSIKNTNANAYSWGSSLTWRGHNFEVGAYARLYLTAAAQKIPRSPYLHATGSSLNFLLNGSAKQALELEWHIPDIWNTFARNRARAYALAFNLAVTQENIDSACRLLAAGETKTHAADANTNEAQTKQLGVGLWGASRGFLAHWAVINNQQIENYQIAIPSRINAGTTTPARTPGPMEKALLNTPILETGFRTADDFAAIDIQRTIQSFDPCMNCTAHVLVNGSEQVLSKVVDTSFVPTT